MTVYEAENTIREIGFPQNEEDQAKYSKATYVVLKAIQEGWNVVPLRNWSTDLVTAGEEIKEKIDNQEEDDVEPKDLYLLEQITNNMLMASLIMMEAKVKDIEDLK